MVSPIAKPSTTKSWAIDSYAPLRSAPHASTGITMNTSAGKSSSRNTIGVTDRISTHCASRSILGASPR